MDAVTKDSARAGPDDMLYYIDCPRCESEIRQPFNRLGGPQYSEHFCGNRRRPRRARFLVAASGTGYFAYALGPSEYAEPILERWIIYWAGEIRDTLPLYERNDAPKLGVVG